MLPPLCCLLCDCVFVSLSVPHFHHPDFASCAYSERWAPKGEAAGDPDVAVWPFAVAVALLVEFVGKQVEWPYLASVGVAAYLYLYAK